MTMPSYIDGRDFALLTGYLNALGTPEEIGEMLGIPADRATAEAMLTDGATRETQLRLADLLEVRAVSLIHFAGSLRTPAGEVVQSIQEIEDVRAAMAGADTNEGE